MFRIQPYNGWCSNPPADQKAAEIIDKLPSSQTSSLRQDSCLGHRSPRYCYLAGTVVLNDELLSDWTFIMWCHCQGMVVSTVSVMRKLMWSLTCVKLSKSRNKDWAETNIQKIKSVLDNRAQSTLKRQGPYQSVEQMKDVVSLTEVSLPSQRCVHFSPVLLAISCGFYSQETARLKRIPLASGKKVALTSEVKSVLDQLGALWAAGKGEWAGWTCEKYHCQGGWVAWGWEDTTRYLNGAVAEVGRKCRSSCILWKGVLKCLAELVKSKAI